MNYRDPHLKEALAAEYVLGTLRGPARSRFQRLLLQFPSLRESTWLWEQHLHGLSDTLTPIEPDQKVWHAINVQLGWIAPIAATSAPDFQAQTDIARDNTAIETTQSSSAPIVPLTTKFNRLWQGLASLATAAAILLAVLLFEAQPPAVSTPQQVAVMQSAQADTLWLIEVNADTIEVRATRKLIPVVNKDYELWMVAKGVENPISLGLLPKSGKLSLPKHAQFDEMDIVALAVSLEPLNGSPNGLPTEVLYTAELAIL